MVRYTTTFICDLCQCHVLNVENMPTPLNDIPEGKTSMYSVPVLVTFRQQPHSPEPDPEVQPRHICDTCATSVIQEVGRIRAAIQIAKS